MRTAQTPIMRRSCTTISRRPSTYREKREARSGVAKTDTGRLTGRIESASYDLGNGHTAFWHKRPDPGSLPDLCAKAELEKQFTPGQLEWVLGRGAT